MILPERIVKWIYYASILFGFAWLVFGFYLIFDEDEWMSFLIMLVLLCLIRLLSISTYVGYRCFSRITLSNSE